MLKRIVFLCAVVGAGVTADAQTDDVFTRATLGSGSRALIELIKAPKLEVGERVEQSCQALISSNDRMAKLQCRKTTDANRALHVAINSAAKFVNYSSARIVNEPITVWLPFRVIAHGTSEGTELTLLLGPPDTDVLWPQMMFRYFEADCEGQEGVAARIGMAADGTATLVAVQEEPLSEACVASMRAYVADLQFIPAYQDGQWIGIDVDMLLFRPARRSMSARWEAYMVL